MSPEWMSEFALAGRVVSAPSASTVLKGRLPFTASIVPLEVPAPSDSLAPTGSTRGPGLQNIEARPILPYLWQLRQGLGG